MTLAEYLSTRQNRFEGEIRNELKSEISKRLKDSLALLNAAKVSNDNEAIAKAEKAADAAESDFAKAVAGQFSPEEMKSRGDQKASRFHRSSVTAALAAGKPVPPEVLADYPDLKAGQGGEKPQTQSPAVNHEEAVVDLRKQLLREKEKWAHQYFTVDGGGRFNDMGRSRTQRQRDRRPYKTPASFEPFSQFGGLAARFDDEMKAGTMTPEKLEEYKTLFDRYKRGDYTKPVSAEEQARIDKKNATMAAQDDQRQQERAERRQERKEGAERNAEKVKSQGFDVRKVHRDMSIDGESKLPDGRVVSWEIVDDNGKPIGEDTPSSANWNYRYKVKHPDGREDVSRGHPSLSKMQGSGDLRKILTNPSS